MIVSFDCFIESTHLNIFGFSKHVFKTFISSFLSLFVFLIVLIVFSIIKLMFRKSIRFIRWICIGIITILFTLYANTTSLILSIFNCKTIEDDKWLVWDLEMICWKDYHAWWAFFYGVPMLVLFVFGLPILGILILFLNRKKLG